MNDIALHPGRTGTDELVPSRYALRVGEIDVLVISDGVLPLPAATLATNAVGRNHFRRSEMRSLKKTRLVAPIILALAAGVALGARRTSVRSGA